MISRRRCLAALSVPLLRGTPAAAADGDAKSYPSRPIRLVVPLAAGGGTEVLARQFAEKVQAHWGQPVVVEARPGANGQIGAVAVTSSPPDGHTLLFTNSGLMQNVHLRPSKAFKLEDLAPVAMLALAPPALAIHTSVPARTLAEFVTLVKASPGKYSFGSSGSGSSGHLLGEMLNKAAGLDMVHVAYKGESAGMIDLIGGQVSGMFGAAGSMARQAQGKARLLAVASPRRLASFPDMPTFAEAGYPELNLSGFMALFAPAQTPPDVIAKLSDEFLAVARLPEMQERITTAGFVPGDAAAPEFAAMVRSDNLKWGQLIQRTGIKVE